MKKTKEYKAKVTGTKVITGEIRFSYCHVFEPSNMGDGEKYSVALLIDKDDEKTLACINKGIEEAIKLGSDKLKGKVKGIKNPLRDGDVDKDDEVYEGMMFINASSKTKPKVINSKGIEIKNSEDFYSGCYGLASVNFYAYDFNGNRGIACGLNNIMKTSDGDYLGGRAKAEDDFAEFIDKSTTDFDGDNDDDDFLS